MLIAIALLALLALFMTAPSPSRRRADSWRGTRFAHRGLHGSGVSENTIRAFALACEQGCGIELDVQLSADGRVVVFHDDDLKRMTGDARRVDAASFDELRALALPDGSNIPSFDEVLRCVNGRVPLLVELKNGRRNDGLCAKVLEMLRAYEGPYIVESFNPLILRWFRKNAPEIIRGQLVSCMGSYMPRFNPAVAFLLSGLFLNFLARPDFVAYDVNAKGFVSPWLQRAIFRTPMASWTVTDPALYKKSLKNNEMPIFEGFLPEKMDR